MAIKSQADQRQDRIYEDQFGRPWGLTIEIKTGDPTGMIYPAGWSDELRIPQQYLRVPRDKYGQPAFGRLEIAFDEWRLEVKRANQDWQTQLYRVGNKVYGMKFDPKAALEDEYLLALVGPKPKPSLEELDRAMQGAALSLDETVPEMASAGVGPTANELASGQVKLGRPRKG